MRPNNIYRERSFGVLISFICFCFLLKTLFPLDNLSRMDFHFYHICLTFRRFRTFGRFRGFGLIMNSPLLRFIWKIRCRKNTSTYGFTRRKNQTPRNPRLQLWEKPTQKTQKIFSPFIFNN